MCLYMYVCMYVSVYMYVYVYMDIYSCAYSCIPIKLIVLVKALTYKWKKNSSGLQIPTARLKHNLSQNISATLFF